MKPSPNLLLAFVPVAAALEQAGVAAPWVFFAAALAIVPIARLIVRSTEQLASYTGDAVGGLLTATFGNAPELIIMVLAVRAGLFDMARASIAGSILANMLLVLGLAFLVGGLRHPTQSFQAGAARLYISMMLVATISLTVISGFSRLYTPEQLLHREAPLNFILALLLLATYVLYLLFMLKTHPHEFRAAAPVEPTDDGARWSFGRAIAGLIGASLLAAWMSAILVGASYGTAKAFGISQVFIGIVFVAMIGGAAETTSAVAMALRNRMDLALGIAFGACIQIALFVAPVIVLASYFLAPQPLELAFTRAELAAVLMAVLIGALVTNDGQSNWFKGVQLLVVYLITALMFYFIPVSD